MKRVAETLATEAEWALLAAVLEEGRALPEVARVVAARDFTSSARAGIYATMLAEMAQGRLPHQIETPIALIRHRDVGSDDVARLLDWTGRAVDRHAQLAEEVARLSLARRTRATLREAVAELESTDDPARVAREVAGRMMAVTSQAGGERYVHEADDLVEQSLLALDERAQGRVVGITTSLDELNRLFTLQPGRLYIVAGRPAMGKSALAGGMVRASVRIQRWGVISLEMEGHEWMDRLLCAEAEVDMGRYSRGWCDQDDYDRLYDASLAAKSWRLRIDHQPGATWGHIVSRAREWSMTGGLDGLVVDYLQLVSKADGRQSTIDHVSEVSKGAKLLARDLRIPVVLLSQLNRGVEQRQDKRPLASDLRDSGSIEQDADVIAMVYREVVYDEAADPGAAEIIVRKQRGGPTGTAHVRWEGRYTRFHDAIREGT